MSPWAFFDKNEIPEDRFAILTIRFRFLTRWFKLQIIIVACQTWNATKQEIKCSESFLRWSITEGISVKILPNLEISQMNFRGTSTMYVIQSLRVFLGGKGPLLTINKSYKSWLRILAQIEITSWKARAYGTFIRIGEVSEIERVSAANEWDFWYKTNECENPVQSAFHAVICLFHTYWDFCYLSSFNSFSKIIAKLLY